MRRCNSAPSIGSEHDDELCGVCAVAACDDKMYRQASWGDELDSSGYSDARSSPEQPEPQIVRRTSSVSLENAATQSGSRNIQKMLDGATVAEATAIASSLNITGTQLLTDVFGNYIIQKLVEFESPCIEETVMKVVTGRAFELSTHSFACRVVQKLLLHSSKQSVETLIDELTPHLSELITDQNGNHVVQRCLEVSPPIRVTVINILKRSLFHCSTHVYGCRVVQRVLEHAVDPNVIIPVLQELLQKVHLLVTNQYGNYVVQHMVVKSHAMFVKVVVDRLKGHYALLCTHKFASNVVELIYENASEEVRVLIRAELMQPFTTPNGIVVSGMALACSNQYGNYVVQKIFDNSTRKTKLEIKYHLGHFTRFLNSTSYGKHFCVLLDRL
eukprot:TRINITY_DN14382_c2_g1_i2.p1 TRINITY_DN14382_c2_g1~~TRINITY_DN14382_c2_g1_i2.p1  ORF type:complete len:410 (+),score=62.94 TRINITY_DN14382_c2_g1_i2:72-1232(+)